MGKTDIPLNSEGRRQARSLKKKLAGEAMDIILCSDLTRCRETAGIIFGDGLEFNSLLREMDFGRWEGKKWTQIRDEEGDEYRKWRKNWTRRPAPGGESFTRMSGRVLEAMEALLARDFSRAAVVTHGGCIRSILGHYILGSLKDAWRFQVDNASAARLCINDGYAYLKSLNEK